MWKSLVIAGEELFYTSPLLHENYRALSCASSDLRCYPICRVSAVLEVDVPKFAARTQVSTRSATSTIFRASIVTVG